MDITIIAGIAAAVGSLVTAGAGLAGYLFNRGSTEGGIKTEIGSLTHAVGDLKSEVERGINKVGERADEAHERIDDIVDSHHNLREIIARDYVTYERMRELKTELSSSIDKMTRSHSDGMSTIHNRLDQLIHSIAKLGGAAPAPTVPPAQGDD